MHKTHGTVSHIPLVAVCVFFFLVFLGFFSTFLAHYSRLSSKRFTFTLTLLAMLPG
jgi:hypothetical protein